MNTLNAWKDCYFEYLINYGLDCDERTLENMEALAKDNGLCTFKEYFLDLYKNTQEEFKAGDEILEYFDIELFDPDYCRNDIKEAVYDLIRKNDKYLFLDGARGHNFNIILKVNFQKKEGWDVYEKVEASSSSWGFNPNNEDSFYILWSTENCESKEYDEDDLEEGETIDDIDYSYEVEEVVEKAIEKFDEIFF